MHFRRCKGEKTVRGNHLLLTVLHRRSLMRKMIEDMMNGYLLPVPGCPSLPIPQLRQAEKPPEKPTGIKILPQCLRLKNRTGKVVIGDGNCLFRALSIQLFNHELLYTRLRAILALCQKENPQWYSAILGGQGNFLTKHVAKMERNGTWGTQVSQLFL